MVEMNFNATEVEPNQAFEPVPAGNYDVAIIDSKMKPTKNGNGQYLELEMQILNGPYQNRKVWDRLNLFNPNDQAVAIAKGTLSAICRAVGVMNLNDSSQLHGRKMSCRVAVKEYNGNQSNEVKGYKAAEAAENTQPQSAGSNW